MVLISLRIKRIYHLTFRTQPKIIMYYCNMRRLLVVLLSLPLLFTSCKSDKKKETSGLNGEAVTEVSEQQFPPYNWDTLKGVYFGPFLKSEIHINLTYVTEFNAVGYSVVNGLVRNVSGKVSQTKDSVRLVLSEQGDNAYDGVFSIDINKHNFQANGKWQPYDSKLASKTFSLKKKKPLNYSDFDYYKDPITADNFLMFYEFSQDSLGYYRFLEDGSVNYEFYQTTDDFETKNGTLQFAIGSWKLNGKSVTVNWQPNFAFPKLKSQFKIVDDRKDEGSVTLRGENRVIYSSYEMGF